MSEWRHIYQGYCPDETQPMARDKNCHACKTLVEYACLKLEIERLRGQVERLSEAGKSVLQGVNVMDWRKEEIELRDAIRDVTQSDNQKE